MDPLASIALPRDQHTSGRMEARCGRDGRQLANRISCNPDGHGSKSRIRAPEDPEPTARKGSPLYFGLGCQRSHSASEIAREFHVSSQVISGIIGGAEIRLARAGLTPSKLREAASFEARNIAQARAGKFG